MQPRMNILPISALALMSVFALGAPALAEDAIQFSCNHINKMDEVHRIPVGNDPDHIIGVYKASGANKSTDQGKFLDGAQETEVGSVETSKNGTISSHHGYALLTAADGTMLTEFSGQATRITIEGKPYSVAVGSWRMVRGTGRYANGYGVGSYRTKLTVPTFEGSTDWDGTFTPAAGEAVSSNK